MAVKVGGAYLDMTAKSANFTTNVDKATKSLKTFGGQGKQTKNALKDAGENLEKQVIGIKKFQGAIQGSVGVAFGLVGTVAAVGRAIGSAMSLSAKWNERVVIENGSIVELGQSIRSLRGELKTLGVEVGGSFQSEPDSVIAARNRVASIEEQLSVKSMNLNSLQRSGLYGKLGFGSELLAQLGSGDDLSVNVQGAEVARLRAELLLAVKARQETERLEQVKARKAQEETARNTRAMNGTVRL